MKLQIRAKVVCDLGLERRRGFHIVIDEANVRALSGECTNERSADARCAARNEYAFSDKTWVAGGLHLAPPPVSGRRCENNDRVRN